MRLLHEMLQFVFAGDHGGHRIDSEGPRLGRHTPMLERPFFLYPLDPPAVENTQTSVSEIFQHPEHTTFVSPVVEWIGIDDHIAVLTDAQGADFLFHASAIGIEQSLRHGMGVAVLMPGRMHSPWNMAAEFVGRPSTHVENHQTRLPQVLLESFGINKQGVCHVVPFVMSLQLSALSPALQLPPSC